MNKSKIESFRTKLIKALPPDFSVESNIPLEFVKPEIVIPDLVIIDSERGFIRVAISFTETITEVFEKMKWARLAVSQADLSFSYKIYDTRVKTWFSKDTNVNGTQKNDTASFCEFTCLNFNDFLK